MNQEWTADGGRTAHSSLASQAFFAPLSTHLAWQATSASEVDLGFTDYHC